MRFKELWQKFDQFICNFLHEWESSDGLPAFELWLKNLWTNQNAGFFKLQYLANELVYEAEFLLLLDICRRNKFTQSYSQLDLKKTTLAMELFFRICWEIYRSY